MRTVSRHAARSCSPLRTRQLIKPPVIETYTAFINHWKHAKEAVKSACLAKTAFSKFLEVIHVSHTRFSSPRANAGSLPFFRAFVFLRVPVSVGKQRRA